VHRIAIAVVAYEAEGFISTLLDRIPDRIDGERPLILVSDDASADRTQELAEKWAAERGDVDAHVRRQPVNLGYGGNQKVAFAWASDEGADIVVLLHGDEQYPPEMIPELVAPIVSGDADAVFGSRMIIDHGARAGGMPMNRFLGNIGLSWWLNTLTPANLTEWFSGFRAYRMTTLDELGCDGLPDGFDFDIAMTLRFLDHGRHIAEIPIPTRYGEEISRVPLARTGLAALRHGLRALGVRYRRRGRPVPAGRSASS
jgi:glycosyltransferase involved in cell wall biosynthesis